MFAEYEPRTDRSDRLPEIGPELVRLATVDDADAIARLTAKRHDLPLEAQQVGARRELAGSQQSGGRLFVAEIDDQIVAFGRIGHVTSADGGLPDGYYLLGVIVDPAWRRHRVAHALTRTRLDWIEERANHAYYFCRATNQTSIDLHDPFGFVELTRDFAHERANLGRGEGILFRVELGH